MIELSIIIVNFNTCDLISDCIDSIMNSNLDIPYEVIIVDNGSSDGSVEKLRDYQRSNLRLKLIENKNNLGFAKANNQGISKSEGEYKLLVNSDTKVKKDTIKKLFEFARKKQKLGAVGPKFLNPDGSVQGSIFRLPTLGRTVKQYWFGERGLLDKYSILGKSAIEVEALSMACFLMTPECIKKVGLLDERYFMYFEDLDYCRRINKLGLKIFCLPNVEIIHYHGASGKNISAPDVQWRRLIPSSKIYHGIVKHYLINLIIRLATVFGKV